MKITDDDNGGIIDFSKIKWIRWRRDADNDIANNREHHQTKMTPDHKSPQQSQAPIPTTATDNRCGSGSNQNEQMRAMHPHIGMNPFLNGGSYLNDIMVQNSMLRGESVRDGGGSK